MEATAFDDCPLLETIASFVNMLIVDYSRASHQERVRSRNNRGIVLASLQVFHAQEDDEAETEGVNKRRKLNKGGSSRTRHGASDEKGN